MAYLQLFFIIVASLIFLFTSPSHASLGYNNVETLSSVNDKVNLSLYYETLCPYCASFITRDLVKVFEGGLDTIVNLRLVPWGNAEIVDNKIICQHGEEECYLNTIHGCVINIWPETKRHFDFIHCTESQYSEQGPAETREKMWEGCSRKYKLNEDIINRCYNSPYGQRFQLIYANETASLNPPHEYVPWLLVNNHLVRDIDNFVKYVCQAYKGDLVPEACKQQSSNISSAKKANNAHLVSYASEFANLESSVAPKAGPGSK